MKAEFFLNIATIALWLVNVFINRSHIKHYPESTFPKVMLIMAYIAIVWMAYQAYTTWPW